MKNQSTIMLVVLACYVLSNYLGVALKPVRLEEIEKLIKSYAKKYPNLTTLKRIGKSALRHPVYCLKIHDRSVRSTKTIMLNFGVHPREYASHLSCLFLIDKLLTDTKLRSHIKRTTWYIIPVINPDGHIYATRFSHMWRKNRRRLTGSRCIGVDLNRNYPEGWNKRLGSNRKRCMSDYAGPKPLSEPETRILKNFLKKTNGIDAFVDIHACAQTILHPYGYTKAKLPAAVLSRMTKAGFEMKKAMKKVRGTNYPVQSAAGLYIAGGGADDFAYKAMKIPIVFTLELGDDHRNNEKCFFPHPKIMDKLKLECLEGLLALDNFLHRFKAPKERKIKKGRHSHKKKRPIF